MSIAEALARALEVMPHIGVTRLADVSRLDRIGLPVFTAIRPNGRSLSVFQGKGINRDTARLSAIMEALETWSAEHIEAPLTFASLEEMAARARLIDVSGLPFSASGGFDPSARILWIEGHGAVDGAQYWVPYECVSADYTRPDPLGMGAFVATTNGMGAGLTRDWALRHALLEVVERDAATLWTLGGASVRHATRINLDRVTDEAARALLDRIAATGFDTAAWDVTSDLGIPTIRTMIADRAAEGAPPEIGTAADLSPTRALMGAVLEAVQARCTFIAGSREDITAVEYTPSARRERFDHAQALLAEGGERVCLPPDPPETDVPAQVCRVLAVLANAGLSEPVIVDLSRPQFQLSVLRVVVPGLEAAYEGDDADYTPGARARALLDLGL